MTATAVHHSQVTAPVNDPRRSARRTLALIAPLPPALLAVVSWVMPYGNADKPADVVRQVMTHEGAQSLQVLLTTLAVLFVIPAFYAVSRVSRLRAPRLTLVGLGLSVVGYAALAMSLATDNQLVAMTGLDAATQTTLLQKAYDTSQVGISVPVFVVSHVLGTTLLGIALYRSRTVPGWAAALVAVSQPLHLVFVVAVPSHLGDAVAWAGLAVGFAVAAAALWHMSDDDYDVAPTNPLS